MRRLAALLRAQSAATNIALYQRKFDGLAADLEESARQAETRESERKTFRRLS